MQSVVITGASSGIGEAVALRMAKAGWRVFAGVRKPADGERVAAKAGGGRIEPLLVDVGDQASIDAAVETVTAALGTAGLDGLVNNAGIAVGGPVEYVPVEEWRHQLDINVIGQIACTQGFLPLVRQARGRILFTGSIGGRLSGPLLAPYSASKHAIAAIAEAMRHELAPAGIKTVLIEPGAVKTEIWAKGQDAVAALESTFPPIAIERYATFIDAMRKALAANDDKGIPADACAAYYERALTTAHPRARYLVGTDAKAGGVLARFLPDRLRDFAVAKNAGL